MSETRHLRLLNDAEKERVLGLLKDQKDPLLVNAREAIEKTKRRSISLDFKAELPVVEHEAVLKFLYDTCHEFELVTRVQAENQVSGF